MKVTQLPYSLVSITNECEGCSLDDRYVFDASYLQIGQKSLFDLVCPICNHEHRIQLQAAAIVNKVG